MSLDTYFTDELVTPDKWPYHRTPGKLHRYKERDRSRTACGLTGIDAWVGVSVQDTLTDFCGSCFHRPFRVVESCRFEVIGLRGD